MSTRVLARLCSSKYHTGPSRANSSFNVFFSFPPRLAVTNPLRTAGLLLQPSANAPSGWLALSAVVGLPVALWAYKVCLAWRFADDNR